MYRQVTFHTNTETDKNGLYSNMQKDSNYTAGASLALAPRPRLVKFRLSLGNILIHWRISVYYPFW